MNKRDKQIIKLLAAWGQETNQVLDDALARNLTVEEFRQECMNARVSRMAMEGLIRLYREKGEKTKDT
jgi:hypothetical protein